MPTVGREIAQDLIDDFLHDLFDAESWEIDVLDYPLWMEQAARQMINKGWRKIESSK